MIETQELDTIIDRVKQKHNEQYINNNDETLVEFWAAQNEMRINNTYFDHKSQYKITWANTQGLTSTIDYIISNKAIPPVPDSEHTLANISKH